MAVSTAGSTLPTRMIKLLVADVAGLDVAQFRIGDQANATDGAAATYLRELVLVVATRTWVPISNA